MPSMVQRMLHPSSLVVLWFGLLAGPLAWGAHLMLSYVLAPHTCALGGEVVLHLITLFTALVALAAAGASWRSWRVTREDTETTARRTADRAHFMAQHGLWMSTFSTFVIVAEGLPVFVLPTCG